MSAESCSWCGVEVEAGDGWRVAEPAGERRAVFCRLEHVFPWALQGGRWEAGTLSEPRNIEASLTECASCGAALRETRVLAVRHRGEHRIPDAFCSVDHLADWAKKGGRWAP